MTAGNKLTLRVVATAVWIQLVPSSFAFSSSSLLRCRYDATSSISRRHSRFRDTSSRLTIIWSSQLSSASTNNDDDDDDDDLPLLKALLERDLNELSKVRPNDPHADFSQPVEVVSAGSSYARAYTAETWKKHSKPPHRRYLRHVWKWHLSSTARKILPAVVGGALLGTAISSIVARFLDVATINRFAPTSSTISFLTAPLALLLTLRANASMTRLLEARLLWGRLVLHARNLSNILRVYHYDKCPRATTLAIRHLALLGWILKAFVRGETDQSQEDILSIMLQGEDLQWMLHAERKSYALLSRIRQISAKALMQSPPYANIHLTPSIHLILEERLQELELCVGGCERLFRSPIPPTYSRHLSRVVVLWILLLPMALVSSGVSTLGVGFTSLIVFYVLIGIDEVGMEIENAFQLLPLQQLAAAAQSGVGEEFLTSFPEVVL